MTRPTHKIAVIAGDGIGTEVMPEGIRVLKAAAEVFDLDLVFNEFEFGSCDYYQKHGQMMPDDWRAQIEPHDAIFFGAVGWPETVPDHISLWGSLIMFRRDFDQYVNLRPAKLMPGVPSPLPVANRVILISMSCARTPKANIPRSAARCIPARTVKSSFRKPSCRAPALIAS